MANQLKRPASVLHMSGCLNICQVTRDVVGLGSLALKQAEWSQFSAVGRNHPFGNLHAGHLNVLGSEIY